MNSMEQVKLVDVMGSDLMVVNSARVSFNKFSEFISKGDEKLIKYLALHNHVTPFFHPQVQFRIRMPVFIARQWFKHTIGFSRNEISRRYISSKPECWLPLSLREKDENKKQGSRDNFEDKELEESLLGVMKDVIELSMSSYDHLIESNVAPEIARSILPQSMYTEFIETGSLAAYARLYKLRTTPDAQKEIREYAEEIGKVMATKFPISWAALTQTA